MVRVRQRDVEKYSVFVGDLLPVVGRPVVIVTYSDRTPEDAEREPTSANGPASQMKTRQESATYWAFFSHEKDSFTAAICQRQYFQGVYPRLGPKEMIARTRDKAELDLGAWMREEGPQSQGTAQAFDWKTVEIETLFGLYVFSPDTRECIELLRGHIQNRDLRAAVAKWQHEFGVNLVPLQVKEKD